MISVVGGSFHTHDFVLNPAALGDSGHFVRVVGSNRTKAHIVLATGIPAKLASMTTMCRRVVQIKVAIKQMRMDDNDVCKDCGDNAATIQLGSREETEHYGAWVEAALVRSAEKEGPAEESVDLVGLMPEVTRLMGGSWRFEQQRWMSQSHCDLVNRFGDRIHLEYHRYLRYAGQVVAYMVLDGAGYDFAAVCVREFPRAAIPVERGAKSIAHIVKTRLVAGWCVPDE